jgi:hypothetical protein
LEKFWESSVKKLSENRRDSGRWDVEMVEYRYLVSKVLL